MTHKAAQILISVDDDGVPYGFFFFAFSSEYRIIQPSHIYNTHNMKMDKRIENEWHRMKSENQE